MARVNPVKLRHIRIRKRVTGTPDRPRLAVHFSGRHIYAQVIDDAAGRTLATATTLEQDLKGKRRTNATAAMAEKIGAILAQRTLEKKIKAVVFDRGGLRYHGKVKALAEAARAGGLEF